MELRITFVLGLGFSVVNNAGKSIVGLPEDILRADPKHESVDFIGNENAAEEYGHYLVMVGL